MSDIVWSIDARNDTIESLVDKMRSFGSTALSAAEVNFSFTHSGLDLKRKLPVDVRENLYLIFKEAITNTLKHAAASNVTVSLENDATRFTMKIHDDGKGWGGKERPAGHGTKNMKMRADRLEGTVSFTGNHGTEVLLSMRRI
jgi:signal transduction histidine kinase